MLRPVVIMNQIRQSNDLNYKLLTTITVQSQKIQELKLLVKDPERRMLAGKYST